MFRASKSLTAGLTVCESPLYADPRGMRLYFGSADDNAIQELTWTWGHASWQKGYKFEDSDPDGGCECQLVFCPIPDNTFIDFSNLKIGTRRGGTITNVWLLSAGSNPRVDQYWYDFNISAVTPTHPTGSWIKGISITPVRLHSALSAISYNITRNVIAQLPSGVLQEWEVIGNGESSKLNRKIDVTALDARNGTKIASLVLNSTFVDPGSGVFPELFLWATSRDCVGITGVVRPFSSEYWACQNMTAQEGLTCACKGG
jgi:hypothetical protein